MREAIQFVLSGPAKHNINACDVMPARIEILGRKFGRLFARKDAPGEVTAGGKKVRCTECNCICGKIVIVRNIHLLSGHTTSCGCQRGDSIARHGQARRGEGGKSRTYLYWKSFKKRPGGIPAAWQDYEVFFRDVGEMQESARSLVPIDKSIGFQPGNTQWSDTLTPGTGRRRTYFVKTGDIFGNWTVIGEPKMGENHFIALCRCICGAERFVIIYRLIGGSSKSCGCTAHLKHGNSRRGKLTAAYRTWQAMVGRCHQPNHTKYADYGGKGISVCDSWRIFENFFSDMGPPPKGCTIDRIEGTKGYYFENCRWADNFQQAQNKPGIIQHTVLGITGCLSHLCRHFGANYHLVRMRVKKFQWNIERAIFTPSSRNR